MNIEFFWSSDLKCSDETKSKVENNFQKCIPRIEILKECLYGTIKIFIEHTGPLDRTLNGQIVCESQEIFAFSSSQDGNNIHIKN